APHRCAPRTGARAGPHPGAAPRTPGNQRTLDQATAHRPRRTAAAAPPLPPTRARGHPARPGNARRSAPPKARMPSAAPRPAAPAYPTRNGVKVTGHGITVRRPRPARTVARRAHDPRPGQRRRRHHRADGTTVHTDASGATGRAYYGPPDTISHPRYGYAAAAGVSTPLASADITRATSPCAWKWCRR